MPSAAVTVTADTGPAFQNTTVLYSNVKKFTVDVARQILTLEFDAQPPKEFDLSAVTTITDTLSGAGGNHVVAVA